MHKSDRTPQPFDPETLRSAPIAELRRVLQELAPGNLGPRFPSEVLDALTAAWDLLDGDDEAMESRKLPRARNPTWEPPTLSFTIERHGAIVAGGSGYAEIQTWAVHTEQATRSMVGERKRRIRPAAPKLDCVALATDLARAIERNPGDSRFRWTQDGQRFQVRMGIVLPSAPAQTTEGRRKRLNAALTEHLTPLGWERNRSGWWSQQSSADSPGE